MQINMSIPSGMGNMGMKKSFKRHNSLCLLKPPENHLKKSYQFYFKAKDGKSKPKFN